MQEHIFNIQTGTKPDGTPIYTEYKIQAPSFAEARVKLGQLLNK
jgi:hypothetical protein